MFLTIENHFDVKKGSQLRKDEILEGVGGI